MMNCRILKSPKDAATELAVHRLKSGKAAGVDHVINKFLKTEHIILPFLVKLCNAIYDQGIFPEERTKKGDCVTQIIIKELLCWAHSARLSPPY